MKFLLFSHKTHLLYRRPTDDAIMKNSQLKIMLVIKLAAWLPGFPRPR